MTFVKMTVLGPVPFGGSTTAELTDPVLDRALAAGGSILRVWEVHQGSDGPFSVELP